jgi:hypothetical protein
VEWAAVVEAKREAAHQVRQRGRLGGGPQRVDQRRRRGEGQVRHREPLEGMVQVLRMAAGVGAGAGGCWDLAAARMAVGRGSRMVGG